MRDLVSQMALTRRRFCLGRTIDSPGRDDDTGGSEARRIEKYTSDGCGGCIRQIDQAREDDGLNSEITIFNPGFFGREDSEHNGWNEHRYRRARGRRNSGLQ